MAAGAESARSDTEGTAAGSRPVHRPVTGHGQRSHVQTVPGEVMAGPARPAAAERSPQQRGGRTLLTGPLQPAPALGPHLMLGDPAPAWHQRPQRGSCRSPRGQSRAALGSPPHGPGEACTAAALPPGSAGGTGARRHRSEPPTVQLSWAPRRATQRPSARSPLLPPGRREGAGLNLRGRAGFHSRSRLPRALQEDATCLKLK